MIQLSEVAQKIATLPYLQRVRAAEALHQQYGNVPAFDNGAGTAVEVPTFYEFVKAAWHVVEPAMAYIDSEHIHHICNHLEAVTYGLIKRLLINMPPGHAKSLLVSVLWPAWMWLVKPEWRVLTASYAMDLASRDSMRSRELIESDWYQTTYQPNWNLKNDQNQKQYFRNSASGERKAISIGGATTGFRGNGVIIDDPLNVMDAFSVPAREGANNWLDQAGASRLNDPATGFIVIVMQRIHHKDMSGHVLGKLKSNGSGSKWEHLCLPTRYESEHAYKTCIGCDWRTKEGELLFPALFTPEAVDDIEADMGPVTFVGQHQQKPSPATGNFFKEEMLVLASGERESDLRFWPREMFLNPVEVVEAYLSYDTATKSKTQNDYTAGSLVIGLKSGYVGLMPLVYKRMEIPDVTVDILLKWIEWRRFFGRKLRGVHIEEGAGTAPVQYLRQARVAMSGRNATPPLPGISEEDWARAMEVDPIIPLPYKTSLEQVARTLTMLPFVAGRNVRLIDTSISRDWLKDLCGFPVAPHDDATQSTFAGVTSFFERFDGKNNGTAVVTADLLNEVIGD